MRYMAPNDKGGKVKLTCKRCGMPILEVHVSQAAGYGNQYKVKELFNGSFLVGNKNSYESRDSFWSWVIDNFGMRSEK